MVNADGIPIWWEIAAIVVVIAAWSAVVAGCLWDVYVGRKQARAEAWANHWTLGSHPTMRRLNRVRRKIASGAGLGLRDPENPGRFAKGTKHNGHYVQ